MIKIYPTTDSGLGSAYELSIPGEINPTRPRGQKVTTTLSGGAAITTWVKNNEGALQTVEVTISEDKFKTLETIIKHATVFEWLVTCDGRRYKCTIDNGEASTVSFRGTTYKKVALTFVVVKDYN